jgi:RNA-directed DNA polymerase
MKKVNWILDADIKGFFDNISHEKLMELVELRIADPRILRLIRKWLTAGVSEEGQWFPGYRLGSLRSQWSETKVGTPQGAVISPLLANIYLPYVLDQWVNEWRKVQANGEVIIVRYADDFVLGFQYRDQAERFLKQLQKRMAAHGLELHWEKTRLIQFGRFAAEDRKRDGAGKPETFNFLGFTHICGTIWTSGKFTVHRKTVGKRMTAKLKDLSAKLRKRMNDPIAETGGWLTQVVRGYLNYHAIPGNLPRFKGSDGRQRVNGCSPYSGAVNVAGGPRSASRHSSINTCLSQESYILIPWTGLPPNIQDKSRVR